MSIGALQRGIALRRWRVHILRHCYHRDALPLSLASFEPSSCREEEGRINVCEETDKTLRCCILSATARKSVLQTKSWRATYDGLVLPKE